MRRRTVSVAVLLGYLASGASAQELECTLGAECERWGALIEDAPMPETSCVASGEPTTDPLWTQPLASARCPFGQCALYDTRLALDTDGSLLTLSSVELPSQYGYRAGEGALWLTRHDAQGTFLSSSLSDFSAPPPGLAIQRHGALLRDASGRISP